MVTYEVKGNEKSARTGPRLFDLDRCVHCGLCLNACPTYRELGLEMDSPRGRIYQMVKAAEGELPISGSYKRHLDLCLGCRACETACPSGVQYGKLIEAARAEIEQSVRRPWPVRLLRGFVFKKLLVSPALMSLAANVIHLYEASGLRQMLESSELFDRIGLLGSIARLAPSPERPYFFRNNGKVFPAEGRTRQRVAMLSGCIANVSFSRLNEATIRVLQKNGCEVVLPAGQNCCGALHAHTGLIEQARALARRNIDAFLAEDVEAIITNTAGCGAAMKAYHELLASDPEYIERAAKFTSLVRDITEFLASMDLNRDMGAVPIVATYQDPCHLAHGQHIRNEPRKLLRTVPQLTLRELPASDVCCGSAGTYNVLESEMAAQILRTKMKNVNGTGAGVIVTANPGCMLQFRAGVKQHGRGQRVAHVVEILDEAYANASNRSGLNSPST